VARPRSLTPQAIAVAALTVIDRDGLAALSMRAVAGELGLTTMALYRYVDDRDQLERLVVDLVLDGVDTEPPRGAWQKQLGALMERARQAVGAHPGVTPLTLSHRQDSDGVRRVGEAMLAVLASAGFTGQRQVIAFRTLLAYLVGALQAQQLGALPGTGTARLAAQADYPHLARAARTARAISPEREFHSGLRIVLAGLSRTPPPTGR
jgi:AcrR family transcriptional regulator